MRRTFLSTGVAVLTVLLMGLTAWAVPYLMNYQGKLTDRETGNTITAVLPMTFKVYDTEPLDTGALLWEEQHPAVNVVDGFFDVDLGSGMTTEGIFDSSLFSDDNQRVIF